MFYKLVDGVFARFIRKINWLVRLINGFSWERKSWIKFQVTKSHFRDERRENVVYEKMTFPKNIKFQKWPAEILVAETSKIFEKKTKTDTKSS